MINKSHIEELEKRVELCKNVNSLIYRAKVIIEDCDTYGRITNTLDNFGEIYKKVTSKSINSRIVKAIKDVMKEVKNELCEINQNASLVGLFDEIQSEVKNG